MNLLKNSCLVLFLLAATSPSFTQSILDEDTFDTDLNGWTSSTGWEWSADGRANSANNFWDGRPPIDAVSGPGALAYRAAEGDIGRVTSRSYDFSGNATVFLRFTQYYRRWQGATRLNILVDGMILETITLNTNVGINIETSHRDVQIFDISMAAGNNENVQLEFVFEGTNYFWLIDDVQFFDDYPYPQTRPSFFGDSLANFGTPYDNYQVDSVGWAYVPKQLVVQFAAGVTEPEKQLIRDTVGAVKISTCVCDRLELWELTDDPLNFGDNQGPEGGSIGILSNKKGTGSTAKVDGVDYNYYNGTQLQDRIDTPIQPLTPAELLPFAVSPVDALRIAILDTGLDITHEEVSQFIYRIPDVNNEECLVNDPIGWNFVDSLNNVFDDNSHGTHVAGIVARTLRTLNHDEDNCSYQILPYKTHDEHGVATLFNVTCATYQAIQDSARIINDSWGFYGDPSEILQNALDSVELAGAYVVSAAGNEGLRLDTLLQYPACYDNSNMISVAAEGVDPNGIIALADFSNVSNTLVDIAAPGVSINSSVPRATPQSTQNNEFDDKSGTSMAAPAVSAALAVAYCAGPLGAKDRLLDCAEQFEPYFPDIIQARRLDLNRFCITPVDTAPGGQSPQFTLYPNPANDRIQVRAEAEGSFTQLKIVDMRGVTMLEYQQSSWSVGQVTDLDLNTLPAGSYFLQIQQEDAYWVTKFIKI
ncbi:S8 family peptidase [Lewinella cohaerens]|uniref:S8 family peptidase n=1 Tax=Lewinella cohaerens TaxID=70995 RepID=UPI00037446C6|nr:S8 family peptidase [Lewinella cohaerens]